MNNSRWLKHYILLLSILKMSTRLFKEGKLVYLFKVSDFLLLSILLSIVYYKTKSEVNAFLNDVMLFVLFIILSFINSIINDHIILFITFLFFENNLLFSFEFNSLLSLVFNILMISYNLILLDIERIIFQIQLIFIYLLINNNNNHMYQITHNDFQINSSKTIEIYNTYFNTTNTINNLNKRYEDVNILESLNSLSSGFIFISTLNQKIIYLNQTARKILNITKNNPHNLKNIINLDKLKEETLYYFLFDNQEKGIFLEKFYDPRGKSILLIRSEIVSLKKKHSSSFLCNSQFNMNFDYSIKEVSSINHPGSSENVKFNENDTHIKILIIDHSSSGGFNLMKSKIFDVIKSKFLITISHELNNPICTLQQSIDSLALGSPSKTRECLEAKFYCGYINFFIQLLSLKMKMSLNENIRMFPSTILLGNLLLNNLKFSSILLKLQKIKLAHPNLNELNKISLTYDYDHIELLLTACLIYIKSVSEKKLKLIITCNKSLLQNGYYCINFLTSFKNQEDFGGTVSSSVNSGLEEQLTITNSVATAEIVKEFIIDFSKKLEIKQEIIKLPNKSLSLSLILQGEEVNNTSTNLSLSEIKLTDNHTNDLINIFKTNNAKKSSMKQFRFMVEKKDSLNKNSQIAIPHLKIQNKIISTKTQKNIQTSTSLIVMEVAEKKEYHQ